jgi:hypothetical protein
MATRAFTVFLPIDDKGSTVPNAIGVRWTGILNGDDGAPFVCAHRSIKSVQSVGTVGATPHLFIEGTNDQAYNTNGGAASPAPTYDTLTDQSGNLLDLTAVGIKAVHQNVLAIRPRATGDGTTNLTVTAILHSGNL